jgi:hypothetical protein
MSPNPSPPTQTHNPPAIIKAQHKGKNPAPLIGLGFVLMIFWFMCSLIEIEATEAWIVPNTVHFIPNWDILLQIPQLVTGKGLDTTHAQAAFLGWGVELVTLVVILGYDIAADSISHANSNLVDTFKTGLILIIIFNLITNFTYGSLGSGILGHLVFTVVLSFVSWFFGLIGFRFVEHGFRIIRGK